MSQPANDDYSQHLSDDEASYHEDASDSGTATNKPKQQQQQLTPTTTTISNIKLPILKKEYKGWKKDIHVSTTLSQLEAHGAEVSTDDANHKSPSKGTNDGKKRDTFYQDQGVGKKEQNQNCLLTIDDGVVNWGEHTVEDEETNHALMAIFSNNAPRVNTGSFNVNTVRSRQPVPTRTSNSFSPKRPQDNHTKHVGQRWMFDIDYLTDSMNYIPVSLDNQSNSHAGTSEVTNSAGTLRSPNANTSKEADEDEELIVVPTAIKHSASNIGPRKSSTNSKEEKFLTELQNLQTQEKEAFSTGISEDTLEILAFRRDLDQLAQKHLREVTTDKATSTNSVNSGSEPASTQPAD
ncbi:hypothetical protein Tco_0790792 [Tanacetum coccineum]